MDRLVCERRVVGKRKPREKQGCELPRDYLERFVVSDLLASSSLSLPVLWFSEMS